MKNKTKLFFIILPMLLSSCGTNSFSEFNDYSKDNDEHRRVEGEGYYKPESLSIDFQEVIRDYPYASSQKQVAMPSTGERNLLVIPVDFPDSACSSLPDGCAKTHTHIQNAFFGSDKKNAYYSVASFYDKSSFGKLHIHGKVADWYRTQYTLSEIKNDKALINKLAEDAVAEYKRKNSDIKNYDTDNDGYIDGVAFVYAAQYETKSSSLWAFEYSVSSQKNIDDPQVRSYIWASYAFMDISKSYSAPDAHTFIHETGHLLGLADYYSTDDSQKYSLMGGMDMMDLNIGDHCAFSKLLLNWSRPYVVIDNATITIDASYINGDCILIPAGEWNGSAMDKYVLLELYSPKGLNRYDSNREFNDGTRTYSLMNTSGIKMYNVDARIAYYMTFNKEPFIGYLGDEGLEEKLAFYDEEGQRYYRRIDHSNTLSESNDGIPLIEVVDRRGQSYIKSGYYYDKNSLLQEGDTVASVVFNNGYSLNYQIDIESISNQKATIKFTKKVV